VYYKVKRLNPELPNLDIDLKPGNRPRPVARQKAKYEAYLHGQLTELLTNYGKIDLLCSMASPRRCESRRSASCRPRSW
jgi:hypothetical protein